MTEWSLHVKPMCATGTGCAPTRLPRLRLHAEAGPALRRAAAAAYARLLLQNKLKLQGMLAAVGEGLAGRDRQVGGWVAALPNRERGRAHRCSGGKPCEK